jgi:hypothetical protein
MASMMLTSTWHKWTWHQHCANDINMALTMLTSTWRQWCTEVDTMSTILKSLTLCRRFWSHWHYVDVDINSMSTSSRPCQVLQLLTSTASTSCWAVDVYVIHAIMLNCQRQCHWRYFELSTSTPCQLVALNVIDNTLTSSTLCQRHGRHVSHYVVFWLAVLSPLSHTKPRKRHGESHICISSSSFKKK